MGSSPTAGTNPYPGLVRIHLEHRIDAPLDVVERASLDPRFDDELAELPNVAERSVRQRDVHPDGTIHRVVRYRFTGPIPAPVVKALGGGVIGWDEIGDFDPSRHEWTFEIRPHVFAGRIRCHGRYAFAERDGATVRVVDVDLKVSVPFVGGRVEKVIADGLKENLEAEARLLASDVSNR